MTPRLAAAVTELELAHQWEHYARSGAKYSPATFGGPMTLNQILERAAYHRQRCYELRAKRSD